VIKLYLQGFENLAGTAYNLQGFQNLVGLVPNKGYGSSKQKRFILLLYKPLF
jgi:hypothetical protein